MRGLVSIGVLMMSAGFAVRAMAHCEIPCGIYDDEARISALRENTATVEKSMKVLNELKGNEGLHERVRWIINKETHANNIQHIVTHYFMTQRIKPPAPGDSGAEKSYAKRLELLHLILVHAMKSKQTTDLKHVATLMDLIRDFDAAYFGEKANSGSKG